jgi:hypothetical protein
MDIFYCAVWTTVQPRKIKPGQTEIEKSSVVVIKAKKRKSQVGSV